VIHLHDDDKDVTHEAPFGHYLLQPVESFVIQTMMFGKWLEKHATNHHLGIGQCSGIKDTPMTSGEGHVVDGTGNVAI
jgi:hypothetical protein